MSKEIQKAITQNRKDIQFLIKELGPHIGESWTQMLKDSLMIIRCLKKDSKIVLPRDVDLVTMRFSKGVDLNIFLRDAEIRAKRISSVLKKYPNIRDEIIRGEHDK